MTRTQIRVELLSDGISALMKTAGVTSEVDAAASRIQSAAGSDFEVLPAQVVGDRVMALVVPSGIEGREAEARDKVLSKAVSACRS